MEILGRTSIQGNASSSTKKAGWLCFTLPRSQVHRKDTFMNCSGQYQALSSTAVDNCRPRQHFKKRPQILSSTKVIICRLCMTSYEAELTNVHQPGSGELTSTADTVITQPAKWNEEKRRFKTLIKNLEASKMLERAVTPLQSCQMDISFGREQRCCMQEGGWRYAQIYLQMRTIYSKIMRNGFY